MPTTSILQRKRLHRLCGWLALFPLLWMICSGIMLGLAEQFERVYAPQLFSSKPSSVAQIDQSELLTKMSDVLQNYLTSHKKETNNQLPTDIVLLPRASIRDNWQAYFTYDNVAYIAWINPYTAEVVGTKKRAQLWREISRKLHTISWFWFAQLASIVTLIAFISAFWLYPNYTKGRFTLHARLMLVVALPVLWQTLSGILAGFGFTTFAQLHALPSFVLRLPMILVLFATALGISFALIGNTKYLKKNILSSNNDQ